MFLGTRCFSKVSKNRISRGLPVLPGNFWPTTKNLVVSDLETCKDYFLLTGKNCENWIFPPTCFLDMLLRKIEPPQRTFWLTTLACKFWCLDRKTKIPIFTTSSWKAKDFIHISKYETPFFIKNWLSTQYIKLTWRSLQRLLTFL